MDLLANVAESSNNDAAASRYRNVRDRLAKLSPLLAPPYFDPQSGDRPDVSAYEADVYLVSATALSEHFADLYELNEIWVSKGDTYILQLSLLAAALALFGLAMTMFRRIRGIFVVTGLILVAVTVVWILIVFFQPVQELPDSAIEAYAKGVGLAYRNDNPGAIDEFNKALAQAPEYGNALYERGNAYYAEGKYVEAVADYREARQAHKDDTNVNWDLGWTLYLLGRYDEALQVDQHAIDLDSSLIGVRLNDALALLAGGQINSAREEYRETLDLAAQQVAAAKAAGLEPPSEMWLDLDGGAGDLTNLVDQLKDRAHSWTEAPPRDKIATASGVMDLALEEIKQIKEFNVALEYTGKPPTAAVTAQVSPLKFGAKPDETASDYAYGESIPADATELAVNFDFDGMQNGQDVLWKVYVDGTEDPSLRVVEAWSQGSKGNATKLLRYAESDIFVFSPGEYVVEMYVDARLAQTGSFTIQK